MLNYLDLCSTSFTVTVYWNSIIKSEYKDRSVKRNDFCAEIHKHRKHHVNKEDANYSVLLKIKGIFLLYTFQPNPFVPCGLTVGHTKGLVYAFAGKAHSSKQSGTTFQHKYISNNV